MKIQKLARYRKYKLQDSENQLNRDYLKYGKYYLQYIKIQNDA